MACLAAPITVDRARVAALIASGQAGHLAPLYAAVLDGGCRLLIVSQSASPSPFRAPGDRPCIGVIADDPAAAALGPPAFHGPSLRRLIRSCASALIAVAKPEAALYAAAIVPAVLTRRNVIIIETRLEKEADWFALICATKPMPTLFHTVASAGSA